MIVQTDGVSNVGLAYDTYSLPNVSEKLRKAKEYQPYTAYTTRTTFLCF